MSKPKILITNDDGIFSTGIYALWQAMCEIGDPIVVAPNREKSATGHSITLNDPLRVESITRIRGFKGWAVDGTPADCTKIAINALLDKKPDLIISGINQGANLGCNLIYSGTLSAASEGTLLGIPSISISLASYKTDDYRAAKSTAIEIAKHVLNDNLPKGTLLNVNVPYCHPKKIKGKRVTRQGNQYFKDEFEKRIDPRNQHYYWIKGKMIDKDKSLDYDGKAVSENYVSITPVHFKITNELYLNELKQKFLNG